MICPECLIEIGQKKEDIWAHVEEFHDLRPLPVSTLIGRRDDQ